ncbi:Spy/CpxP family protein refolding chaperone [Cobetia crustatorum]|uniref:Periplasmic heavy metal sensor n=1 Tax=Cobetia crustatorum TaxID=553385 RepID=A0A558HFA8_9GAMM|nr:Spy/CpxP family protein refolding chaperone [Cobetia crustatorum]TVU67823.1 hypothetical protein FQP86_15760 [Cobetia crustatorum]
MNRISRKLIVSGLLTALALPMTAMAASNAKTSEHDASSRKAGMEKILASWNLSDEQQQQLDELQQQRMESRKQIENQTFDSREDRRAAIKAQRDQSAAEMAKILDENQMTVLTAYWNAGKHDGKHGGGKHDGKQQGHKKDGGKAGGKHMVDNDGQRMALMGALFDSWNLDDSQRDSLKDSFTSMREDMKALKDTDFDSREARKAAFKTLRDTQHERLSKVLNDDQIKVLDLMHQRDKRGPKMAERQQKEGMKALLASWNLSDEQQQALKDIRDEMRDDMRDSMKQARADMQEAKQAGEVAEGRKAQHEKMREAGLELRKEGRDKLADVLSSEQLDALEAFMDNGMRHHAGQKHSNGGHATQSVEQAPEA